jgi:predicted porin
MKKSLLALAILGAFAGVAQAQTQVTIYGVADVAVAYDKGAVAAGSTTKLSSGQQNGSRLGFMGSEDLGGGLKANFKLENGYNIDDGTQAQGGRLFGRNAWVGLSGNFGAVTAGRQDAPIYNTLDSIDPFGANLGGDITRTFFAAGLRTDNTIKFSTPDSLMNGVKGTVAYTLGEQAGSTSNGRQVGLSGSYANGPVMVALAYHNVNNILIESTKATVLGGTYNFGVAKLHAAYDWEKIGATATTDTDKRHLMIGVSAPVGQGTVLADYIRTKNKTTGNMDSNQWALGYTYAISKRTGLYTSYTRIANDSGSTLGVDTAGATDKLFLAGVRHKF